jgi:hypothetical protein
MTLAALAAPRPAVRLAALLSLRQQAPALLKTIRAEQVKAIAARLKDKDVRASMMSAAVLGRLGAGAKSALPALFAAAKDRRAPPFHSVRPWSVGEAAAEAALRIDLGCGPALAKACLPALTIAEGFIRSAYNNGAAPRTDRALRIKLVELNRGATPMGIEWRRTRPAQDFRTASA